MISRNEVYVADGERGTPYTLEEARGIADEPRMDRYQREIMCWLIYEVERLEKEKENLLKDLTPRLEAEEEKRLMEAR